MKTLDELFSEAQAAELVISLLEYQHWRSSGDFQWVCWLRSRSQYNLAAKGEGYTAASALNSALNTALSLNPEPDINISYTQITYGSTLPSLDTLMPSPRPQSKIIPGVIRR